MELGLIVKNTVIIGAILGLVFLSQQPYFRSNSKIFSFPLLKKGEAYFGNSIFAKAGDLLKNNPYASISGEVTSKTNALGTQITAQKNNLQNHSVDATKKFLAEKLLSALGVKPEDLVQCKSH